MRRHLVSVVVVAGFIAATLVPGAAAQTAPADTSSAFVAAVNAQRAAAGLPPVVVDPALSAVATSHSVAMADSGALVHTADLLGAVHGAGAVAENIGRGLSADAISAMFVASPPHLANILGGYSSIGIGVVQDASGQLWVTEVFAQPMSAPAPAAAPPAPPAPAPVPAPAAPPAPAPAPAPAPPAAAVAPAAAPAVAVAPAAQAPPAPAPAPAPAPEQAVQPAQAVVESKPETEGEKDESEPEAAKAEAAEKGDDHEGRDEKQKPAASHGADDHAKNNAKANAQTKSNKGQAKARGGHGH